MLGMKRGQGATEYLVLLAVVLIIALVAIALLGFFPGLAGDARITQSQAYWQGTAQPVAITQSMQATGVTTLQLVVQNMAPTKINITAVTVDGAGTLQPTSVPLSGGETGTLNVTSAPACGASGTFYEYSTVVITYNTAQLTGLKQTGSKALIGKCS